MQTDKINSFFIQPVRFFAKGKKNAATNILSRSQLIKNFKILRNFAIFILLANSVSNYILNYSYSFFVTALAAIIVICTTYFINDKFFKAVRYLFVCTICVSICTISYVEGIVTGGYLFLFVLLIITAFIFDFEESKALIISYITILASFLFIFTIAPLHSIIQPLNEITEKSFFIGNLFCAAIITCILSFILLRHNFKNSKFLVEKQQFLDAIYNTSLDGVFIVEVNTMRIKDCNSQSIKLFDVKDKTFVLNKPISSLFKDFGSNDKISEIFENKKESWQGDITCCTTNGLEFPGYVSIVPFIYGEIAFKKINILDISDIKKAQAELLIAKEKAENAIKIKSTFLSNMSHELRTPLNGIIGTANLLLDEASMPEQKEHFNLLKYSSEHMLNLINDVLDFSKIEADKMILEKTSFNLKDFFIKIQSLFAGQFVNKGLLLELLIDEKLNRYFLGDETRLSQVLNNLITNAFKFTENGKVVVTAKMIGGNSKNASIYFSVKDSGIGISEKQQKIIFHSFTQGDTTTTRKFGGTGLGLSISKNIVELYKGQLEVESKKGEGSNFYFTIELDLQLNNKNFVNENVMSTLTSLTNLKVLIAEDNKINMMVARKFLRKWNIIPSEALNGIEALNKFKEEEFDVLLIDLEMPEMDGYETINIIRKTNEAIPVIAFTAAVYDNMHADLISKGFTDYIQKPFRPEDLHRKLAKYTAKECSL